MSLRRIGGAAWGAVSAEIGRSELLLIIGMTLVTVAVWPLWGRTALVVPGLISLAIALAPVVARKG